MRLTCQAERNTIGLKVLRRFAKCNWWRLTKVQCAFLTPRARLDDRSGQEACGCRKCHPGSRRVGGSEWRRLGASQFVRIGRSTLPRTAVTGQCGQARRTRAPLNLRSAAGSSPTPGSAGCIIATVGRPERRSPTPTANRARWVTLRSCRRVPGSAAPVSDSRS